MSNAEIVNKPKAFANVLKSIDYVLKESNDIYNDFLEEVDYDHKKSKSYIRSIKDINVSFSDDPMVVKKQKPEDKQSA